MVPEIGQGRKPAPHSQAIGTETAGNCQRSGPAGVEPAPGELRMKIISH